MEEGIKVGMHTVTSQGFLYIVLASGELKFKDSQSNQFYM